ncbi:MAG: SpoIIE family protein phosphatase [Acidobacteria bacterium]|nr:SpoIIE family protein phosphatase [Acidobacteriota bacterium]
MNGQVFTPRRIPVKMELVGDDLAHAGLLDDLSVLDDEQIELFERMVLICTVLFDVPMAAISLIDGDHQRFVAKRGFDLDGIRPQDQFLDLTKGPSEIFIVEDTSADPRFAENPHVVGYPHIAFYAGFPIETQARRVGTICIMDSRSRVLTDEQEVSLQGFAMVVQTELARRQGRGRAVEVHRALLPPPVTSIPGYQVAGVCVPWRVVGGDYYDWTLFESGELVVSVGDVMGKGISAAVIMASVRAAFKTLELRSSLAQIVSDVAHALDDDLARSGSFVTVFHALIDLSTGDMEYVDAGHGLAIILHPDGSFKRLPVRGIPIGVEVENEWTSGFARLDHGDTLLVVSDGFWRALGGNDDARNDIVARVLALDDLAHGLDDLLDGVRAREALDDITALALRRDGR